MDNPYSAVDLAEAHDGRAVDAFSGAPDVGRAGVYKV